LVSLFQFQFFLKCLYLFINGFKVSSCGKMERLTLLRRPAFDELGKGFVGRNGFEVAAPVRNE
jgi:hypothetical protein